MTSTTTTCGDALDPRKLVRGGTRRAERTPGALLPGHAPVDERTPARALVFAAGYTTHVRYVRPDGQFDGTWHDFFASDISSRLAIVAIADVGDHRSAITSAMGRIVDLRPNADPAEARRLLGEVFSRIATLARRLDDLCTGLGSTTGPALEVGTELRASLDNLIGSQLAPDLQNLVAWFKAGTTERTAAGLDPLIGEVIPDGRLLGAGYVAFSTLLGATGLSAAWPRAVRATSWADFVAIAADATPFGTGATDLDRIQHLAGHASFRSVLDRFLRAYARSVVGASSALRASFAWNGHQPHNALFLAFVRLLEHIRAQLNTLTGEHRDFYYERVLGFRPRPAVASTAHVLVELAKHADSQQIETGTRLRAGKDDDGNDRFATVDRELVANRAKVTSMRSIYRHHRGTDDATAPTDEGRIYASPVARSDDGAGAELTAVDGSWHPFANTLRADGTLAAIRMPRADIGFAIASHHLLLAEGKRSIAVVLRPVGGEIPGGKLDADVRCRLTTADGWFEVPEPTIGTVTLAATGSVVVHVVLSGGDPAITPHVAKIHGPHPQTDLPVLEVLLRNDDGVAYRYDGLARLDVESIDLRTGVGAVDVLSELGVIDTRIGADLFEGRGPVEIVDERGASTAGGDGGGLRTVVLGNDLGELDPSKPFQPFGPSPKAGSALVLGSKELFQKQVTEATIAITWTEPPRVADLKLPDERTVFTITAAPAKDIEVTRSAAGTGLTLPDVELDELQGGVWRRVGGAPNLTQQTTYTAKFEGLAAPDTFDPAGDEPYTTAARHGFLRLRLTGGFGQDAYPAALASAILRDPQDPTNLPVPPVIPTAAALSIDYRAEQSTDFTTSAADRARLHLFQIGPFGSAEVVPATRSSGVRLVPQYGSDQDPSTAELLLGIEGLQPPQQVALLFQVADGTANPLAVKPRPHLRWSYLRDDAWVPFAADAIDDGTDELLVSGIVTLDVPADAQHDATILPAGPRWIRVAAAEAPDTACRLIDVAPQALRATIGTPASPGPAVLPAGTIRKLERPDPAVKATTQPFASFGGRAEETATELATRASERLRHKDRASTMWDHERLVLEAFPSLDQVRCLNHTRYGPDEHGIVVYDELAPGHVTVVTIPDQQHQNRLDPLRPATSLGLLAEIEDLLRARMSCFAELHVRNPQFEEVWVDFRVRFRRGTDETFHRKLLQTEITRFLSPWAFPADPGSAGLGPGAADLRRSEPGSGGLETRPSFNGRVRKSVVLNFVEERTYVDYVADFTLHHRYLARTAAGAVETRTNHDVDEAVPSRAVSILVSVPASVHRVDPIHHDTTTAARESCPCEPRDAP